MSRIGKKPVALPKGVSVTVKKSAVAVKGPKGELSWELPERVTAEVQGDQVKLERADDSRRSRALHGLSRSLVQNMVTGVSEGFKRELDLVGVGYRAQMQGNDTVVLTVGYSNPVEFKLAEGVSGEVDKKQTHITLTSIDRQKLGQVAANLRAVRPPDSYKGKGIRYSDERIRLKAGKAGRK